MRKLFGLSLLLVAASGCIIVPARPVVYRPNHYHRAAVAAPVQVCPPSYHWDGYACVHNGHAYGRRR